MSAVKEKHTRIEHDVYLTPHWCIDGLMQNIAIKADDVLLEPAMGEGRIIDFFPKENQYKWADIRVGVDYLKTTKDLSADVIITNPPFSIFMDFVQTAIHRDLKENGTVCMLLRLSVLGSKSRADFWRDFPPSHVIVLTPRPAFLKKGSDNSEYAWFCWDYGNRMTCPALWNIKRSECAENKE